MLTHSSPRRRLPASPDRPIASFLAGAAVVLFAAGTAQAHPDPGFRFGVSSCRCTAPDGLASADFVLAPASQPSGTPRKWGASVLGTPGGMVTYSFADTEYAFTEPTGATSTASGTVVPLSTFMPAGHQIEIRRAFDAWSAVANIQFVEVDDNGLAFNVAGATGDIRIGGHDLGGSGGTLAHGFYPPPNGNSAAGDIHFDTRDTWAIGFANPGFDIFQVAAHEIGHAIGLEHTSVANSLMNPFYAENFTGLQADDIAGVRSIYGAAIVAVPEASTLALLPIGVLAVRLLCRRRKPV